MMSKRGFVVLAAVALVAVAGGLGLAKRRSAVVGDTARVDAAIKAGFSSASPEWAKRLAQDETQRQCTAARNAPAAGVAESIQARARSRIVYPAGGRIEGDWKRGEALAQSGYGGRFTDTDGSKPNGGNCYACHKLAPAEISYGTLGPPLTGYGKANADAARAVYDKIYDSNAAKACSQMPRFGASGFLTPEQIADIVAYVVSPSSPVNQ